MDQASQECDNFWGCCLPICVYFGAHQSLSAACFLQSPEMPESRDGRSEDLADLSGGVGGGGFFIRRVASPGALAVRGVRKPLARRYISPSRNKENLLPVWALRVTPTKRSPLPGWYPRTPLRDITAIAKVCILQY